MNKAKRNLTLVILAAIAAAFMAAFGFTVKNGSATAYAEAVVKDDTLKSEYVVGDELDVSAAKILVGETELAPDTVYLTAPNGVVSYGNKKVLSLAGKYLLTLYKTEGGVKYKAETTFIANEKLFSVSSNKSSAEYLEQVTMTDATLGGMHVKLSSGDTFNCNAPINLNDYKGGKPFFNVYPYNCNPQAGGDKLRQASTMVVKLTDCYDPSVYVTFSVFFNDTGWLYYRAGASCQSETGLRKGGDRKVIVDGDVYYCYMRAEWGADGNRYSQYGIGMCYDVDTARVNFVNSKLNTFVNDLDNPGIYEKANRFNGFTTGEVFLSVYATDYIQEAFDIEITQIGDLTGEDFNDKIAPASTGATVKGLEKFENGVYVEKGKAVTLPEAKFYAATGIKEESVSVKYGGKTDVEVIDGKFTPVAVGDYVITYRATDYFGGATEKSVTFTAASNVISLNAGNVPASVETCKTYVLPEFTASSINGEVEVNIEAIINGESVAIDTAARTFVPLVAGNYTLRYTVKDVAGEYVKDFAVTSVASDNVTFSSAVLPDKFIKGATYALDGVTAVKFENGKSVSQTASVLVKNDNGDFVAVSDPDNFTVNAENTVTLKYVYGAATSREYTVGVVDTGLADYEIDMAKYFVGNGESSADESGIVLKATQNASYKFINAISFASFNFGFKVDSGYTNFSALTVKLTDYFDESRTFTITYSASGERVNFTCHDYEGVLASVTFSGLDTFVSYRSNDYKISEKSGVSVSLGENIFPQDKVRVEISLEGVTAESRVTVVSINNQTFSSVAGDYIKPDIYVPAVDSGIKEKGSVMTVYAPVCTDVLSLVSGNGVKVSLYGANGNLTDENGRELKNVSLKENVKVTLSVAGEYTLSYKVTDGWGNEKVLNYTITVIDKTPPVVTIENNFNGKTETANYKSVITVKKYTVSAQSETQVLVMAYAPSGKFIAVGENGKFTASEKGVYRVCYHCYDKDFNQTTAYYFVKVA